MKIKVSAGLVAFALCQYVCAEIVSLACEKLVAEAEANVAAATAAAEAATTTTTTITAPTQHIVTSKLLQATIRGEEELCDFFFSRGKCKVLLAVDEQP